jgi:DNA-binding NtrC family response regulator
MARRILVVDDQEMMVDIVREAFPQDDVYGVDDASKALEYIRKHGAEVVITDVMLPGMKGNDLFFQLKDIDPFIQIIVMTAYPTYATVVQMIKAGACDFLLKPFDVNDLSDVVSDALSRVDRWALLRQDEADNV